MIVTAARPSRHLTSRDDSPEGLSFAKRPRSAAHREELLNEAAVYDVVRDHCAATAARLPRDARWDPDADELRMQGLTCANLAEHVEARGALEPAVATAVGRAIGELHAEGGDPGPGAPRSDWLRGGVGIARPTLRRLSLLSAAGIELLKLLQRSAGLMADLDALAPPEDEGLVHGDLRWENLLVAPGPRPTVWLVDWEMGGAGERAWDVACFAAAGLSAWLRSIPRVPGMRLRQLTAEAALPLRALEPGMDAFWAAYDEAARRGHPDGWIERCAQLAAVRLVYAAFECTQFDVELHQTPVVHLQVAAHLLQGPERGAHELLRMP